MKNKNGLLSVVKRHGNNLTCRCDCGVVIKTTLTRFYKAKSCGCLRKKKLIDRSKIKPGQKFGFLEAVETAGKDKSGNSLWACRCFCGNLIKIRSANLISAKTRSCGCLSSALRNETFYANHPSLAKKYIK